MRSVALAFASHSLSPTAREAGKPTITLTMGILWRQRVIQAPASVTGLPQAEKMAIASRLPRMHCFTAPAVQYKAHMQIAPKALPLVFACDALISPRDYSPKHHLRRLHCITPPSVTQLGVDEMQSLTKPSYIPRYIPQRCCLR